MAASRRAWRRAAAASRRLREAARSRVMSSSARLRSMWLQARRAATSHSISFGWWIVGGPTAGTNGNVNPFKLPGGFTLTWTGMKVLKHDGSQHHGIGIRPTVPVSRTRKGVAEGKDEILLRGVEVVKAR